MGTVMNRSFWRKVLASLGWMGAGALLALLAALGLFLKPAAPLERWHRVVPEGEFRARDEGEGFEAYLQREARLFQQMDSYRVEVGPSSPYSRYLRYARGGPNTAAAFPQDFNRTWDRLPAGKPAGAALLIHGLSDSPYSLHAVGDLLAQHGYRVLALRLPGHGTVPAALTQTRWEDWASAVRLAAKHLRTQAPEGPFLVCGYSAGGALAANYALDAEEGSLPRPSGLILFSPAAGVTPLARFVGLHRLISWLPWLGGGAWLEVDPELDPFKYSSFPRQALQEMAGLTRRVESRLKNHAAKPSPLPPALIFLSVVDASVTARDGAEVLQAGLGGGELVLVDLNRSAHLKGLLREDPAEWWRPLPASSERNYTLTVLANVGESAEVEARSWRPGALEPEVHSTGLAWPKGTISLSHVALPFPPDDPLYGEGPSPTESGHLRFGSIEIRGEYGVLAVPLEDLLRLRYNPFYPEFAARMANFSASLERREK